ncbi:MAG: MgtC/SapB family protein, partial [Rhizobiales bacterium]|nr:MgtC/SapB family protein [Hyphomicrobiales bacterium]
MDQYELLSRLTVSLAIGLLIGLERGWRSRDEEDHQRAAGFRTFALSGLLGGIAGAVSLQAGGVVIGFVFVAYTAAFAAFHWLEATVDRDVSATSVVAGMVTFLLGTMSIVGDLRIAIACAVAAAILLALREPIHRWVAT